VKPGRLFLRSFLIQASWNPRDLLGTGVAWALGSALAPSEAKEEGEAPAETEGEWIARWSAPFNAHPFLAGLALGALVRMSQDGVPEETQHRFRAAIRSPLGALGDGLIWAGWLPVVALLAGCGVLLGGGPVLPLALFLGLFNVVHLPLRIWGVRAGLRGGMGVSAALRALDLAAWSARAQTLAGGLAGVWLGLWIGRIGVGAGSGPLLIAALGGTVLFGVWRGRTLPPMVPGILALLFLLWRVWTG
jgi:mannose PTS system EIID component